MKIYLISNNLLLDGLNYEAETNLELVRLLRPLSIEGESIAKEKANLDLFNDVEKIICSFHSSSLSSAKYLADKLNLNIILNEKLNDCKVGLLGNKNMKMLKGLQEHDFTYKLPQGESLNDVGNRLDKFILSLKEDNSYALFTHKRAILGFLLKYAKLGYNLDENLILEYNENLIYDDIETNYDIYEILIENKKIVNIKRV